MKQNVEDIKESTENMLVVTLSHLPTLALCGAAAAVALPILTISRKKKKKEKRNRKKRQKRRNPNH